MNTQRNSIFRPALWVSIFILAAGFLTACGREPKSYTIGILNLTSVVDETIDGFKAGMMELGYIEGQNISYFYEGATGSVDGLDAALANIMAADVDLIFVLTTPGATKVKAAVEGSDLPVVFTVVSDPVGAGLVDSLIQPGGNLTGVRVGGSIAKQLGLIQTLAPGTARIYIPHNPDEGGSVSSLAETTAAAPGLGIEPVVAEVRTQDELSTALATIPEDVDAIFLLGSGFLNQQIEVYVNVAIQRTLPLISMCNCAEQGVLMTYGYDYSRSGQQSARLVDQIFKGASAGEIPVETTDFFMSINLQTARAIGLEISDDVLAQADDLVR